MAEILDSSDEEFEINMINWSRDLMEKVDNMQEQIGNLSREMETLRIKRKC